MMYQVKAWFSHSFAILGARLGVFAGLALEVAQHLTADPAIDAAIRSLMHPRYVPAYVIGVGLLAEICLWRKPPQSPPPP